MSAAATISITAPSPGPTPAGTDNPAARRQASGPDLVFLPTPVQMAARVPRPSIGEVIADICRDLGIMPNHPLWRELQALITRHRVRYPRWERYAGMPHAQFCATARGDARPLQRFA